MNIDLKILLGMGYELVPFLAQRDIVDAINPKKTTSIFADCYPKQTEDKYLTFLKHLYKLRLFFIEVLKHKSVSELLDSYDFLSQTRIRNFTLPFDTFLSIKTPIFSGKAGKAQKRLYDEQHKKLLGDLKKLPNDGQELLWKQRVAGSIRNWESRSRIVDFINESLLLLSQEEKIRNIPNISYDLKKQRLFIHGDHYPLIEEDQRFLLEFMRIWDPLTNEGIPIDIMADKMDITYKLLDPDSIKVHNRRIRDRVRLFNKRLAKDGISTVFRIKGSNIFMSGIELL